MMNDELEHVGVLGMKWGKHSASRIGKASVVLARKKLGMRQSTRTRFDYASKKFVTKVNPSTRTRFDYASKKFVTTVTPSTSSAGNKKGSSESSKKVVSNSISKLTTKNKRGPNSTDHANVEAIKGKKMSTLSNAQLKTFNERVQLERTYKQLISDRGATKKSTKFIKDLLLNAAKQNAQTYIAKSMGNGIEKLITRAAR